ncbi:B-cell differentiation antigen CD72-like [Xenopus laevis]|uniref:C-type lectin domain-containing protein n=2 Tax=Xenopus laevis TaxID=8355 RepID=A0A974E3X2_XENLA|nr:B-cell differentiation antigen CD72-like [Xenopus laevis]OCU02833.1 hypothetical protein XELAEV_18008604mg [Xenopus laevis]
MNEAVTYADLQFGNLPLKECQKAVFKDDEEEDPGATYENVESLNGPIRKVDNSAPEQVYTGLQSQPSKLLLLLVLLFLGSFSAMVGIIIKYLQVSRELEEISRSHLELNSSLSWEIQSKEETLTLTHMRLSNLRTEFNQLVQDLNNLNGSLQLCDGTERTTREDLHRIQDLHSKTMEEKETMQNKLNKIEGQLRDSDTEYCPPEWIRFGMRCLFFSEMEETWENSKLNCEEEKSTLLILRDNDNELTKFISNKQPDYWVGNAVEWDQKEKKFQWKTSNTSPECWNYCVKISKINTQFHYKMHKSYRHKWICEKKLVLLDTVKDLNYKFKYYFNFSGDNEKFRCEKLREY